MRGAHKAGDEVFPAPAVSLPVQGSHCVGGQDLNHRAKLRAVVNAFGGKPCFVRFDDGRTAILSAEALRIVDIPLSHEALNA